MLLPWMTSTSRANLSLAETKGATVVETLMSMGMALIMVVFLMNALLMLYTRSVIQHAADTGARVGALSGGSDASCEGSAHGVIADLAHTYRRSVTVTCVRGPELTTATVQAQLQPMFPSLGPSWSFTMRGTAVTEPVP